MEGHRLLTWAVVGIFATASMDLGGLIGLRLGIAGRGPRRSGPDLIGRWIGYLLRGKIRHADILLTPRLPGEIPLGVAAHYLIGIILTLIYSVFLVVIQARPAVVSAVVYGLATTIFSWFVMFPSEGMGWMGRDLPVGEHLGLMSLFSHFVFGMGLALWITILRPV